MGPLEQAKSAIIRQFDALATTDQQASIVHFQTKVESDVDLLAWMKGQSVYPQFYLRFRDEAKTVAAVGKVRSFSDVNLAQQFIQEHDFPLVGGLQFQGESQFILPQVLIKQQNGETVVSVFVETNELDSAKMILNSFEKMTALSPLNQLTIESVAPKANQNTWCDWVNQALNRIRQGELTKLVLANETVFRIQGELNGKIFLLQAKQKIAVVTIFYGQITPKTVLWVQHQNACLHEMIASYLRRPLRALRLLVIIRVKMMNVRIGC